MNLVVDTLVLGCTHYPIVRPVIERIVGPGVRIIDPAPAIARRVDHLLQNLELSAADHATGGLTCWTSGDPATFAVLMERLHLHQAEVRQAVWREGVLTLP